MPPKVTPEKHYEKFCERRQDGDYDAIFMHGCCYHFALALHKKFGYSLEYVPGEPHAEFVPDDPTLPLIGHCWAVKEPGRGIDINGVRRTIVLKEIYSESCPYEPVAIDPELLMMCLLARKYPDSMNNEAFALADFVIEKHVRMQDARPLNLAWMHDDRSARS